MTAAAAAVRLVAAVIVILVHTRSLTSLPAGHVLPKALINFHLDIYLYDECYQKDGVVARLRQTDPEKAATTVVAMRRKRIW